MSLRVGVVLIVLSFVGWLVIPVVPFLGLGGTASAVAIGALVIGAEVVFWLGLVLAGRDTWLLAKEQGWRGVPAALWEMLRTGKRPPARTPTTEY